MVPMEPGAARNGRRLIPLTGGDLLLPPVPIRKGVVNVNVVTYEELFQLLTVLISFASLIVMIIKKK